MKQEVQTENDEERRKFTAAGRHNKGTAARAGVVVRSEVEAKTSGSVASREAKTTP